MSLTEKFEGTGIAFKPAEPRKRGAGKARGVALVVAAAAPPALLCLGGHPIIGVWFALMGLVCLSVAAASKVSGGH